MSAPGTRPLRSRGTAGRRVTLTIAAVAAAVVGLGLAGCGSSGSGTVGRASRDVASITAVELTGDARLVIEQTGVESLTVETDDNLMDNVSTNVVDGTLVLEVDGFIDPTDGIAYELTVADLERITLTGSGSVEVSGLDVDQLDVSISGSGTAPAQAVDIGGAGTYEASELTSTSASVDISGSGTAAVHVTQRLEVDIAGSGAVTYRGDPIIDQQISGAGRVTPAA